MTENIPSTQGSSIKIDLECELCHKPYNRRDLLLRHRRRCQGPRKSGVRRKACEACVQSKTKCCYSQPTCTRCAIRGAQCVYSTSSQNIDQSGYQSQVGGNSSSSVQSSAPQLEHFPTSTESFDLDLTAWDFSTSPYSNEAFNTNLTDLGFHSSTLPDLEMTSSLTHESLDLNTLSQDIPAPRLAPPSNHSENAIAEPSNSSTYRDLVSAISKYPFLLTKGSFLSPLLHLSMYSLYSNAVPDMTFLPQTSMAICCGSGLEIADSNRFFTRALDAARQRLIGNFPSFKCMQQWDGLHAMLLYEMLELRESIRDVPGWYHHPRVKGLRSPFLLKMTQSYLRTYPQIRSFDINAFADPKSSPCQSASTPWARWRVTETARRTTFFANMLNFHNNRDHSTGKLLPYYESFDEDLILNMPLPCSQAAWIARNEEDWQLAMSRRPPLNFQPSSILDQTRDIELCSESCLKNILSKYTKESVQNRIGGKFGFDDSEELRNLIILSAVEQFVCRPEV